MCHSITTCTSVTWFLRGDALSERRHQTDAERIAVLESEMDQVRQDLADIKADIRKILTTFNEMSGGKKAVLALFSIVGGLVGAAVTIAGMILGKH